MGYTMLPYESVPTPALLVDRVRLVRNIEAMQSRAEAEGVHLRPHIKTHKCIELARVQQGAGAVGITVATPEEAVHFAGAGFRRIRMAYIGVGPERLDTICRLMSQGVDIDFCVDSLAAWKATDTAFSIHGLRPRILIELDTGHGRCGVRWDDPLLVELASRVVVGGELRGLLTHGGHAYAGPRPDETAHEALQRVMTEERDRMLAAAIMLQRAEVPGCTPGNLELSVGSTPTATVFQNRQQEGFRITELRPGNYVFHDGQQIALGTCTPDQCALTVLARVIHCRREADASTRLFLNAGKKTLTSDLGYGVAGYGTLLYSPAHRTVLPHAIIDALSEEHAWVRVSGGATLQVGDVVEIIPNHACVTVAQKSALHIMEDGAVAETWAIER